MPQVNETEIIVKAFCPFYPCNAVSDRNCKVCLRHELAKRRLRIEGELEIK